MVLFMVFSVPYPLTCKLARAAGFTSISIWDLRNIVRNKGVKLESMPR